MNKRIAIALFACSLFTLPEVFCTRKKSNKRSTNKSTQSSPCATLRVKKYLDGAHQGAHTVFTNLPHPKNSSIRLLRASKFTREGGQVYVFIIEKTDTGFRTILQQPINNHVKKVVWHGHKAIKIDGQIVQIQLAQ